MMYIPQAHRILEALLRQIQCPHDISLQFYGYFPMLPVHMEKAAPFLPATLHNTVRLHSAFCPHLPVFYQSGDKEEYREGLHLLLLYNAHHLLPQVQFLFPGAFAKADGLLPAALKSRGPEAQGKSFPFQIYPS